MRQILRSNGEPGRQGLSLGEAPGSWGFVALSSLLWLLAGCQQKMAVQPSLKPLAKWEYGPDGASSRLPVAGTVARGHLRVDTAFYRGRPPSGEGRKLEGEEKVKADEPSAQPTITAEAIQNENFVTEFPLPVTRGLLEHGRNRFMIYCVVCHDAVGTGHGKIVERGYTRPPSYHVDRLRNAPVGRLFAIVSKGYGSMPAYEGQIPPRDRWAIVAYVRALQLSQHFPEENLTAEMRRERDEANEHEAEAQKVDNESNDQPSNAEGRYE